MLLGPLTHSFVHAFITPVRKDLPGAELGAGYTVVIKTDLSFNLLGPFLPHRIQSPHLSKNVVSKAKLDTL